MALPAEIIEWHHFESTNLFPSQRQIHSARAFVSLTNVTKLAQAQLTDVEIRVVVKCVV